MTEEIWKEVPGYEGLYEVSDLGRVRSLDRVTEFNDGRVRKFKGRLLTGSVGSHGYWMISLYKDGQSVKRTTHDLVLTAFEGPRPEGYVGCHFDGDKSNNKAENLRWDTYANNMHDSVRQGAHYWARRGKCSRGHDLVERNIRPRPNKGNSRECKACHRAWASSSRRGVPFDERLADEKYNQILKEGDK